MIDHVSDIFAFACSDAQWWDLLDEDGETPPEIASEVDREAFEAACAHVAESIQGLLEACLEAFKQRLPVKDARYDEVHRHRLRPEKVRVEQAFWVPISGKDRHLVCLTFEEDWDRKAIRLFCAIYGPKGSIDAFEKAHPTHLPETGREGDAYYASRIALTTGEAFPDVARRLVDAAWPLVESYVDQVAPRRGQRASPRKGSTKS